MSIRDEGVSFSLEINVEPTYENIRKLQTILYRTMGLLRRFGLPEEIDAQIMKIQRLIILLNQLRLTMIAVHTAAGPIGWALAGLGAATFAFDAGDLWQDMG